MICWSGGFAHVRSSVIYILPMTKLSWSYPSFTIKYAYMSPRCNSTTAKNLLFSPYEANRDHGNSSLVRYQLRRNIVLMHLFIDDFNGNFMSFTAQIQKFIAPLIRYTYSSHLPFQLRNSHLDEFRLHFIGKITAVFINLNIFNCFYKCQQHKSGR